MRGLLLLLLTLTMQGGWQRVVQSGKGAVSDMPTAHALTYFTADPLLRDEANELCEKSF